MSSPNFHNFRPYVPEEFADFSVYNASLDNRDWIHSKTDFMCSRSLDKEISRSPTTSSMTSGYFSHSASNATLSDIMVPSSDSMDQLSSQARESDGQDLAGHHPVQNCSSSIKEFKDVICPDTHTNPSVLTEKSAFDKVPHSTTDIAATALSSNESCFSEDSSSHHYKTNSVNFLPCEVSVEHTCNVLEDHSFTEFMGVEDWKDFEHHDISQFYPSNGDRHGDEFVDCTSDISDLPYVTPDSHLLEEGDQNANCLGDPALFNITHSPENSLLGRNHMDVSDCEDNPTLTSPCLLSLGDQVCIGDNKFGTVRYIGRVDFSRGIWVGVELHAQLGKHDGSVKGKEYFRCKPKHGVFVRPGRLTKALGSTKRDNNSTSQAQPVPNTEKHRGVIIKDSPTSNSGQAAVFKSGNEAASAFSRKQENRKSWIN